MPDTADQLADRLRSLVAPGARKQLVARGLARGMIWRDGELPSDAPFFRESLTTDLLDHGYAALALALQLRDTSKHRDVVESACRVAAEAIESAVRRGIPDDPERGFHLTVAAAAFHIAGYAARSYSLMAGALSALNLSSSERILVLLMRRELAQLRLRIAIWLRDPGHTDDVLADSLQTTAQVDVEGLLSLALARNFHRALGLFVFGLTAGEVSSFKSAIDLLRAGTAGAASVRFVPHWWINVLARHLIDDLWDQSLHNRLPRSPTDKRWNEIRGNFIATLSARNLAEVDLWPSQLTAAKRAIDPNDDLIVALPTSAGKTRIAEICILRALALGRRVVYVTPLRALSAQIEYKLGKVFSPLGFSVSSLYGASGVTLADVDTLRSADIVVATPEKLDFAVRQDHSVIDDVALIVLDEGHMIGLGKREIQYEVLVQRLLERPDKGSRRLVCLSAVFTAGDAFEDFTRWLRSDETGVAIQSKWRPTRQRVGTVVWQGEAGRLQLSVDGEKPFVKRFVESEPPVGKRRKNAFPQNEEELVIGTAKALIGDGHRVLLYCPQRGSVEKLATLCLKLNKQGFLPDYGPDASEIARAIWIGRESLGETHIAVRALKHGIVVHHGGLPRPFLAEVERLLDLRIIPLVIASPTLAQGVEPSCSALVFRSIYRAGVVIPADEYANVVGRAGRAYVDLDGISVYPVYDKVKGKLNEFTQLQRDAEDRQLESGLLLLVERIIEQLAAVHGDDLQEVAEYVLNATSVWNVAEKEAETAEERGKASFADNLGDLDAAILATIEDLDCDAAALADVLDAALRSSYWRRRLDRQDQETQDLQRQVLIGRASWVWNHSSGLQRRGYFAAGLGYEAGNHIDANLDDFVDQLFQADAHLADGSADKAATALIAIAEDIFTVHPFRMRSLPANWTSLLRGWITGKALGDLLSDDQFASIDFIQKGLVFRLVWGLEAIRVHAATTNHSLKILLTGASALALTYGAPSVSCALLLQSGLPSRSMAMDLMDAYPGSFTDSDGFRDWLSNVLKKIDPASFWDEAEPLSFWESFVSEWRMRSGRKWTTTEHLLDVEWLDAKSPAPGTAVQLVDDVASSATCVCNTDLTPLGELAQRFVSAVGAQTTAVVAKNGQIRCTRYGRPIRK